MSMGRAIVNITGNAVATVVMSSIEGELDRERMRLVLTGGPVDDEAIALADHPANLVETGKQPRSFLP
jgi:hypothetical protein